MHASAAFGLVLFAATVARAGEPMVPLIDLGAGTYMGAQGGLYPGGANVPPPAHLIAALQMAQQIVPRNTTGQPDPQGRIGLIAIGMSNTNQEFGAFHHQEDGNTARNARLIIVGTAQGGQDSTAIANPNAQYWAGVTQKIAAAGLSDAQVQVAWLKEAKAGPTGGFPTHATLLRDDLRAIAQILHERFPNLRLCYLSTRTYGGYSGGSLNPEPYAYESGFSAKWLIEDQIDGDPALNYGQLPGIPPEAPLLLWGPYLWANGATPNGQGLLWLPTDFEGDGTHPAPAGEQKVADRLSGFFGSNVTTQAWWPAQPGAHLVSLDPVDDAYVRAENPGANFGNDDRLLVLGGETTALRSYVKFDLAPVKGPILFGNLSLRAHDTLSGGGAQLSSVPLDAWSEDTITWTNAPAPTPAPLVTISSAYSRGASVTSDVTAALQGDQDGALSLAVLVPQAGGTERGYHSSDEALGRGPRLVLAVGGSACPADVDGDGVVNVQDLVAIIIFWGPCAAPCLFDLNQDGVVDVQDMVAVIVSWGPCG